MSMMNPSLPHTCTATVPPESGSESRSHNNQHIRPTTIVASYRIVPATDAEGNYPTSLSVGDSPSAFEVWFTRDRHPGAGVATAVTTATTPFSTMYTGSTSGSAPSATPFFDAFTSAAFVSVLLGVRDELAQRKYPCVNSSMYRNQLRVTICKHMAAAQSDVLRTAKYEAQIGARRAKAPSAMKGDVRGLRIDLDPEPARLGWAAAGQQLSKARWTELDAVDYYRFRGDDRWDGRRLPAKLTQSERMTAGEGGASVSESASANPCVSVKWNASASAGAGAGAQASVWVVGATSASPPAFVADPGDGLHWSPDMTSCTTNLSPPPQVIWSMNQTGMELYPIIDMSIGSDTYPDAHMDFGVVHGTTDTGEFLSPGSTAHSTFEGSFGTAESTGTAPATNSCDYNSSCSATDYSPPLQEPSTGYHTWSGWCSHPGPPAVPPWPSSNPIPLLGQYTQQPIWPPADDVGSFPLVHTLQHIASTAQVEQAIEQFPDTAGHCISPPLDALTGIWVKSALVQASFHVPPQATEMGTDPDAELMKEAELRGPVHRSESLS